MLQMKKRLRISVNVAQLIIIERELGDFNRHQIQESINIVSCASKK
jgi:hypothetical protein